MNNLSEYLRKCWKFRFLVTHLVGSDLRARFRRSHIGIFWAILQPMSLALLFSFVLANVFQQPFKEQALYVFSGVVAWDLFSAALGAGSQALLNVEGFLRQSKIPLFAFQVRSALNNLLISVLGFVGFVAFCAVIDLKVFSLYWLFFPVWLIIAFIFTLPLIIISSLVNVVFRDYQQAIGVVLQALWYVSPVFIPREVFDKRVLGAWTSINPCASLLDLLRDPLLLHKMPDLYDLCLIGVWTLFFSLLAVYLLNKYERKIIYMF